MVYHQDKYFISYPLTH